MPSAVNIVVADATPVTPVIHTFIPLGKDDKGILWFEDQSQATPAGFWRIAVAVKRPAGAIPGQNTQGRRYQWDVSLYEPQLETVSNSTVSGIAPAPVLSYVLAAHTKFIVPERATKQNRQDLRKMIPLVLQSAQIVDMIDNLTMYN